MKLIIEVIAHELIKSLLYAISMLNWPFYLFFNTLTANNSFFLREIIVLTDPLFLFHQLIRFDWIVPRIIFKKIRISA